VDDFVAYAELLFERFGDRVKNWITLNEVSLSDPGEYLSDEKCELTELGIL
jgi:6-phospho-beta-glucosidase